MERMCSAQIRLRAPIDDANRITSELSCPRRSISKRSTVPIFSPATPTTFIDWYIPRAIRAGQGVNRATPILALTANTDLADIEAYLAAGMASVVGKPLQADRLLEAIAQALDGAEEAAALRA